MAQSVEHVIGNDEVISSILITSSKKRTEAFASVLFFALQNESNCTNRLRLVLFAVGELRVKGNYAANVSSDSDYQLQ